MAEDLTTYQAGVGRLQGANSFYMKDSGNFQFYNTDLTGRQLELSFLSRLTVTQYISASITLSGSGVISPGYGHFAFSNTVVAWSGAMLMPNASKGAEIFFTGSYLSGSAVMSLWINSNAGITNLAGVALSSIEFISSQYFHAACNTDGTWQIVANTNVTEHALA